MSMLVLDRRTQLYSGEHKTIGYAHQFVCDLIGNLMHISDSLPGHTHDAQAMHAMLAGGRARRGCRLSRSANSTQFRSNEL
jgi:hypothetical protein